MSVIVKGMKMPNNCMACDLEEVDDCGHDYRCPLIYKGYTSEIRQDGKLPKCPLGELPEKHGRLIDGDELFRHMNIAIAMMSGMMKAIGAEDDEGMQMELKAYRDIRDGIKDCDTVIEAEG